LVLRFCCAREFNDTIILLWHEGLSDGCGKLTGVIVSRMRDGRATPQEMWRAVTPGGFAIGAQCLSPCLLAQNPFRRMSSGSPARQRFVPFLPIQIRSFTQCGGICCPNRRAH
jgi:hypothetical protein